MQFHLPPSPCQRLDPALFSGCQIWVKRDDLLHANLSGNKFRKLKYPLLALQGQQPSLVSMGGPWSNHLHALAHAGALLGWPTTGLVRGAQQVASATLDDCRALGMQLQFVARDVYRTLRESDAAWRGIVAASDPNHVWLPEGGSAAAALRGVAESVDEIIAELGFVPDTLMVACGTGATLAGLLAGMAGRGRVIGVAVFPHADYLYQEIARLLRQAAYPAYQNYDLLLDRHHGGYGKAPPPLRQFCRDFGADTGIALEPVYTGKLFHALQQLAQSGSFRPDEKVVAIHTGGMQGARGFSD